MQKIVLDTGSYMCDDDVKEWMSFSVTSVNSSSNHTHVVEQHPFFLKLIEHNTYLTFLNY